MMRVALLFLVVVLVAPLVVESLKCRACGTYECGVLDPPCKYGEVKDICNCCPACAKGPGEECGGAWDMGGKCQLGLKCVRPAGSEDDSNTHGECTAPSN